MNSAIWVVDLFIKGPVALARGTSLTQPKGINPRRQFYSDIAVHNALGGLRLSVTVRARESNLARKAALVFVGETLDALAADINVPLAVCLTGSREGPREPQSVKRVVLHEELMRAFARARWLAEQQPLFLRALSWFRKGLTTEDPLDQFFAFWLSLEIVAENYHPQLPEAQKGTKSRVWESFKNVWGEVDAWPIIKGQKCWIDENHEQRVSIAHGTVPVDVDAIERAAAKTEVIAAVAHRFLADWAVKHFPEAYVEEPRA